MTEPRYLVIHTADLLRILTEAQRFAERDNCFPVIYSVQLTCTGTDLIAAATDRFVLGASRTEISQALNPDGVPKFEVLPDLDHVRLIGTALRQGRRTRAPKALVRLRVTPKATRMDLVIGGRTLDTVLQIPTMRQEFVQWRYLIPEELPKESSVPEIGLDAQKLAQFATAGRHRPLRWYFQGPTKGVVCLGADFVGIIMPVRNTGQVYERPAWLGVDQGSLQAT